MDKTTKCKYLLVFLVLFGFNLLKLEKAMTEETNVTTQGDVTDPLIVTVQEDKDVELEVNSINVTGDNRALVVDTAEENASAKVTVAENVSNTNDNGSSSVIVDAMNGGTSTVDIGADVTASNDSNTSGDAKGVFVSASNNTSATSVSVNGDVTVSSKSTSDIAVSADGVSNSAGNGTSTVTIGGDINVNAIGDQANAIGAWNNSNKGTSTMTVGGDINVTASNETFNEGTGSSDARGVSNRTASGNAVVNVSGKVTVTGESAVGVEVSTSNSVGDGQKGSANGIINGDIQTRGETYANGAAVVIYKDAQTGLGIGKASLSAGGDIQTTSNGDANGIVMYNNGNEDSEAELSVSGSVKTSGNQQVIGLSINDEGTGNKTNVTVGGNVQTTGGLDTEGVSVQTIGENGVTEVSLGGSVQTDGENQTRGLLVNNFGENNQTKMNIEGNIQTTGSYINGISVRNYGDNSTADVITKGNVSAIAESNKENASASGAQVESRGKGSKASLEISGTVDVQANTRIRGVTAGAYEGGSVNVRIGDGVSANADSKDEKNSNFEGIGAYARDENSEVNIRITDDVTLTGMISAASDETKNIDNINSHSAVTAYVNGGATINISIQDGNSIGIIKTEYVDEKTSEIMGDSSKNSGIGINVRENDGFNESARNNVVEIRVEDKDGNDEYAGESFEKGNVIGGETGLAVSLQENSDAAVTIVASGTIMGGTAPVLVNQNVSSENLTLTVWKIVPTETGEGSEHVVVKNEVDDEEIQNNITTEETKKIEQNIQYIIKVEPNAHASLVTEGTKDYEGYKVANQGDRVTLKVSAEDGYYIEGAFNGLGERVPLRFENGAYYIDIPMGGGVYLSARVGKREDDPQDDSSGSSATRISSKEGGWVDLSAEDSKNKIVIPSVKSKLKGNERSMLEALSPMQQMLVVLVKAGFEDAVNASGFKLTPEAKMVAEQISADLRDVVKSRYRWENDIKVKWYVIEVVLHGNQNARFAFRQSEDGTWIFRMF